jgi:hypothetical protein
MFGLDKPPIFETLGKKELSLTMHRIKSWDDHGYGLSMSYYVNGEVEGGHEATIWGDADDYWRGGDEIKSPMLRMHIKLSSDLSRRHMERGIIGGGRFYEEYVEVELNLEPEQVRDIVYELRISSARQVYVSGFAISDKIFRATRFGFSEPRDNEDV